MLIVAVAAIACCTIPLLGLRTQQDENLATIAVVACTILALLVWLLLFARLGWKYRISLLIGTVLFACLTPLLVRVRGVSGDMLPILEWRWTKVDWSNVADQPLPDDLPLQPPVEAAGDFSQILGSQRDGTLSHLQIATDWDTNPPQQVWRHPIGAGWSGFSVVGDFALTMEQRGEHELVTCYDLQSGKLRWSHADDELFQTTIAGEGPRSVPTISNGRVFTLGATGRLNCLQLVDGKSVWSKNVIDQHGSSIPDWGLSGSPLVVDGKVIVSAGGSPDASLIACDVTTGQVLWSAGDGRVHYSSPVLYTLCGVRQVLIFNREAVVAHDVHSGEILWQYPWPPGHPHITMPVVVADDQVLISSGYGVGAELIQVACDESRNWTAEQIWKSKRLKSKFANMIVHDGFVFGLDDGIGVCIEVATGKLRWKRGRYGHGQLLLLSDILLVMTEQGRVVLLEPTPTAHRELAEFVALDDKTWNPPAIAGEFLLVRNDQEAACYRLPLVRQ